MSVNTEQRLETPPLGAGPGAHRSEKCRQLTQVQLRVSNGKSKNSPTQPLRFTLSTVGMTGRGVTIATEK